MALAGPLTAARSAAADAESQQAMNRSLMAGRAPLASERQKGRAEAQWQHAALFDASSLGRYVALVDCMTQSAHVTAVMQAMEAMLSWLRSGRKLLVVAVALGPDGEVVLDPMPAQIKTE